MADDLLGCPKCDAWAVAPLAADARYQTGAMLHWRTICPECSCVTFHDGHRMSFAAASALRDKFIDRTCDDALSRTESRADLSEAVKTLRESFKAGQPWPWLFHARRVLERAWQAAERIGGDFPERPSTMDACKYASPAQQNDLPQVLDAFGLLLRWCAKETPADGGRNASEPDAKPKRSGGVESCDDSGEDGKDTSEADDAPPKLTTTHFEILEQLRILKASEESPQKQKDIAPRIDKFWTDENLKEPMAFLSKHGYVGGKVGRSGGNWPTPEGLERLRLEKAKGWKPKRSK